MPKIVEYKNNFKKDYNESYNINKTVISIVKPHIYNKLYVRRLTSTRNAEFINPCF